MAQSVHCGLSLIMHHFSKNDTKTVQVQGAACQVPNGRPNRGTGMPKNIWVAKQKGNGQVKIFLDCQNKLKFY